MQRIDLVVEGRPGEVTVHGPFPIAAAPGRTSAIGDDHGEALVGEPLRGEKGVVRLGDPERMRSPVGIEQNRQRPVVGIEIVWQEYGRSEFPVADTEELDVRLDQRGFGKRRDLVVA